MSSQTVIFFIMGRVGDHSVKLNKPGSEGQILPLSYVPPPLHKERTHSIMYFSGE